MSKDLQTPPKDNKSASGLLLPTAAQPAQFNSGLKLSMQQFAPAEGAESKERKQRGLGGAPAESPHRWQIRYADLTLGASKGRGAYGEVFAGKYRKEDVAIKLYDFRGQLPEKQQAEILHEAELMGNLRPSKYLVGFRGICFDPRYCLVMEFCDRGTLRARLDSAREIAPLDSLRWAMQISYGIYNLHEAHILHRDLKGENILLDTHSQAKVADFGLSLVKSSSASQSKQGGGNVAGTLPWMAPELFAGKPPTPSADVYSLGMVLWEITSRQQPMQNVMAPVIIGMALAGTRPTVEEAWPLVFRTLMKACWDGDPAKRPTAQKVGEEFEAALSSVESVPKIMPKSAAELEVEQLREQLKQAQLEKEEAKKALAARQAVAVTAVIPAKAGIHPPIHSSVRVNNEDQSPVPVKTPTQAVGARMDPRLRGDDIPLPPIAPLPQPPVRPSQIPQSLMPAPKPEPVVDAKALAQLLKLVAEGEQDQAETLIQSNKQLLLASGPVTDLSGRTFKSITAFQYALWAMDYHMWTMIKKYLPTEAQAAQLQRLEAKGTEHDKHFSLKPLTDALQTLVDNAEKWNYDQRADDHWNKGVGGAQRLVPAHVVNEYARPDRPFNPCPTFTEAKLPRTREMKVWDGSQYVKGSWFIAPSSELVLGATFAFYRGSNEKGVDAGRGVGSVCGAVLRAHRPDLLALQSLWKTRTKQLEALKSKLLTPAASQSPVLGFK